MKNMRDNIYPIIIILLFLSLLSCNNRNDKLNIESEKIVIVKPKCWLNVDTFSFKGITIGENISKVKKKYSLSEKLGNIWIVKNPKNLTIFGYSPSEITISTINDTIFKIELSIENNLVSLKDIINKLAERYQLESCVVEKDNKPSLLISNRKLSIEANAIEANIVEGILHKDNNVNILKRVDYPIDRLKKNDPRIGLEINMSDLSSITNNKSKEEIQLEEKLFYANKPLKYKISITDIIKNEMKQYLENELDKFNLKKLNELQKIKNNKIKNDF